jgi:hypothetical protein
MLLRVIRGVVDAGREADFVAACRQQVADGARAPGLAAFFPGYRRVAGADRFLLASTWDTEEDAVRVAGDVRQSRASEVLAGIASIESIDVYSVLEPAFRGIVDAPGGVIRVTTARVPNERRPQMSDFLNGRSRDRERSVERLVLGWCLAERTIDDEATEVIAVSAWPSPLVIEAVSEAGRSGAPLTSDVDSFASGARVEQFRAVSLELPDELSDVGSRRLIAARFATRETAEGAAGALGEAFPSARDTEMSVAPLGKPGTAADDRSFVLVARVSSREYASAERLIGDHGGDVILSQTETGLAAE